MNILLKPYNICPECFSRQLTTDIEKQETHCSKCGLIVKNTEYPTLTTLIKEENIKTKLIKQLKEHGINKNIIETIKNSN